MIAALITTDSHHHRYFAEQVGDQVAIQHIALAEPSGTLPFDCRHEIDALAQHHDLVELPTTSQDSMRSMPGAVVYDRFDSPALLSDLRDTAPDLVFVFGSDRLCTDVADVARIATVNLHAGFPERYRGLDTLLWATYHRDFDALGVALHHVEPELDGGRIVLQTALPIDRATRIWHLRTLRTRASVELATMACAIAEGHDRLPGHPQLATGRYYSHMSPQLKDVCRRHFDAHVAQL